MSSELSMNKVVLPLGVLCLGSNRPSLKLGQDKFHEDVGFAQKMFHNP